MCPTFPAPSPQVIKSAAELRALRDQHEIIFLLAVPPNGPRPSPAEESFALIADVYKHVLTFAVATTDVLPTGEFK